MTNGRRHVATRRGFLAALGTVAVAGCSELAPRDARYQLVGGVERTLIRGHRDGTNRKVAETRPTNSSVVDSAPTDVELRTVAYDTAVVDLSGEGDMALDATTVESIEDGYDNPYGVVVLTLYNDDPYNETPTGNSYGYRVSLSQLRRVTPGDRVTATVDTDRDIVAIDEVLTVNTGTE